MDGRTARIRENERKSHISMYTNEELYQSDGWLRKPVQTVIDILPRFRDYKELHVLDLGCGVGRNCIYIAQEFKGTGCFIDCVDILETAIEILLSNARACGVESGINGVKRSIEEYRIEPQKYDLIIAVSALEHVESERAFARKLREIGDGICPGGIACLIVNSEVSEENRATGERLDAQFEVNLPTERIQALLGRTFKGWSVLKTSVKEQEYDIPRETGISRLKSKVVTFVAQRE